MELPSSKKHTLSSKLRIGFLSSYPAYILPMPRNSWQEIFCEWQVWDPLQAVSFLITEPFTQSHPPFFP